MLKIFPLPALQDNYIWVLIDEKTGITALVDPAQPEPVLQALANKRITRVDYILNTHHHADHTGANLALKRIFSCEIMGAAQDAARIPGIDQSLSEGDTIAIGKSTAQIIETPGHTSGDICFYFAGDNALFCGDTLFSLGCGRLFEGTPPQMWDSLSKIALLPDDTMIYCAHEYTEDNGTFGLLIEPDNTDLQNRMKDIRDLRAQNRPTLPVSLATEKKTNIFLRAGSAEKFATLRHKKDTEFD